MRNLLSRRDLLASTMASSFALLVNCLAADELKKSKQKKPAPPKTFLFVDWYHVKKGDLEVTLDPAKVTPEGKKLLETYARDFAKRFDQSGHGTKPVDIPTGVRITQEIAKKTEPWLKADQPWERDVSSPTVLFDEGRYRCWYTVRLPGKEQKSAVERGQVMEVSGSALAYAESADGKTWTKPKLSVLSFQGSRSNNLVSAFNNGGSVFRDDHGKPEERYKGFQFDEILKDQQQAVNGQTAKYGLFGVSSPDGYRWTRNPNVLIRYFCDTVNIAAWDAPLGKYVGYFRHHASGRTISRAETDNFWNWPHPVPMMHAGPLDSPADDYYTSGFTTYPGEPAVRLLFAAIYHHDTDGVDVRAAVSREGRVFEWLSYAPIIERGTKGKFDGGSIYAQPNLIQLPDGTLALPFDGYSNTHNAAWYHTFYGTEDRETGVAWAAWQDGRLAGIEATAAGSFTAHSARFEGREIQLNTRTQPGGSIALELRERGKPLEGFTFADFAPLAADVIWSPCRWRGDLKTLRGKSLEVAFRLDRAKVYGYRFA